jgi:hypothetical protein
MYYLSKILIKDKIYSESRLVLKSAYFDKQDLFTIEYHCSQNDFKFLILDTDSISTITLTLTDLRKYSRVLGVASYNEYIIFTTYSDVEAELTKMIFESDIKCKSSYLGINLRYNNTHNNVDRSLEQFLKYTFPVTYTTFARDFNYGTFEREPESFSVYNKETNNFYEYSKRGTIIECLAIYDLFDIIIYNIPCDILGSFMDINNTDVENAVTIEHYKDKIIITIKYISIAETKIITKTFTITGETYKKFRTLYTKFKILNKNKLYEVC